MSHGPAVTLAEINAHNSLFTQGQSIDSSLTTHSPVTWVAAPNHITNMSLAQVKKLLGVRVESMHPLTSSSMRESLEVLNDNLPASFDCRTAFPGKLGPVRDQGKCGSCWAESATEVLSARIAIQSNGRCAPELSAQPLVSCVNANGDVGTGCDGNTLENAWKYLSDHGTVDVKDIPYSASNGTCSTTHNSSSTLYKAVPLASIPSLPSFNMTPLDIAPSINIIKTALQSGPVQVAFMVPRDFLSYNGGVYKYTPTNVTDLVGGHAVMLVGWGKDDTAGEYWIVQNSWGPKWGENGFFRIEMLVGKSDHVIMLKGTAVYPIEINMAVGNPAHLPTSCVPPSSAKFNCVQGNCELSATGSGLYSTLAQCQSSCPPPVPPPVPPAPGTGFNCVQGKCAPSATGSGLYSTLAQCQSSCPPPVPPPVPPAPGYGFNCVRGNCVSPATGEGQFSTFDQCQTGCKTSKKTGLTEVDIVGIVLGSLVIIAIIIAVSVLIVNKNHKPRSDLRSV